jgi:hypothetical protein
MYKNKFVSLSHPSLILYFIIMSKKIYKIILIVVFLQSYSSFAEVIEIQAAPDKGFNFPFLLKIPEDIKTNYLVVETNNTGKVSDNFDEHYSKALKMIKSNSIGPWIANRLKAPILIPVFPRAESTWDLYTHALDRDTLLEKNDPINRIDLQLLAMIQEAKKVLENRFLQVEEKIIMTGFSASGTFANRFSLLHPDALKVVVAGGLNGILMLPTDSVNNMQLNYPLGINDFEEVTGKAFGKKNWKKLPQFLFMGEKDTNDAAIYHDAYSDNEREIIFSVLGKNMQPQRWQFSQNLYSSFDVNVVFKTYEAIGHGTNLSIHKDILAFINKHISS